ncbi:hypothetical protein tb265_26220 [Gemmatimonadetes bacterium T265]|nr:hypothetical protein tb265_26220 [Gemmatimonadetes bacterium T265]
MRYTVELEGAERRQIALQLPLAWEILETLDKGAKRALRLHTQGRSELTGRYPSALAPAAAITLIGAQEVPARLTLRAPRIEESISGADLLRDVPKDASAVGLYADAVRDALEGRSDSDNLDEGLVAGFKDLEGVFTRGVESVRITNGRPDAVPVEIRQDQLDDLRNFRLRHPSPRTMRLVGKLDVIRHSDNAFTLIVGGAAIRGAAAPNVELPLQAFYGQTVIMSGVVHFKGSGRVLRFEARDVAAPMPHELSLWSGEPRPLFGTGSGVDTRKPQGARSGLNAVYGRWPIPGSDAEVAEAIASVSAPTESA